MTALREISAYEVERNKPMPIHVHGLIQANVIVSLSKYRKKYGVVSEVTLATNPKATPDICILSSKKAIRSASESKLQEAPLITIEIQSPSQSIEVLQRKAVHQFFTMAYSPRGSLFLFSKVSESCFPTAVSNLIRTIH
ncbi:MAG: Uma2 family endonuclease [Bacteroidota bacterium]